MRTVIGRVHRLFPAGALAVAGGLAVLGVTAYVFLAVAGSALPPAGYSAFSVLWVSVFALGPGLFLPLEQELARVVAARTQRGEPEGAVVAKVAAIALAFLAVLLALIGAAFGWITRELFDDQPGMTIVLMANMIVLAIAHLSRGVLAGTGRFGRYGIQLGIDGIGRSGGAAVLVLAGVTHPVPFGIVLALAQLVSVLVTCTPFLGMARGSSVGWRRVSAGLGLLLASTLCAQLLVNAGVVLAQVLGNDPALAGELLSGWVIARTPLFAFQAVQASLLPGLARAYHRGDHGAFRAMLRRALLIVAVLGVGGAAVCTAVGPPLVQTFFGATGLLDRGDFLLLSLGTTAFMAATALGQALVARGSHAAQVVGWAVGLAVLLGGSALPLAMPMRVELAYAAGSLVAALAFAALLSRRAGTAETGPDEDEELYETVLARESATALTEPVD